MKEYGLCFDDLDKEQQQALSAAALTLWQLEHGHEKDWTEDDVSDYIYDAVRLADELADLRNYFFQEKIEGFESISEAEELMRDYESDVSASLRLNHRGKIVYSKYGFKLC